MGAPRYQLTGMQRSDGGHWLNDEETRVALTSIEAAGAFREHVPAASEASTVDIIAGLRAAFEIATGAPPHTLESDYEVVRDAVACAFNPPDEDAAESCICSEAICRASRFIADTVPCECTAGMVEDNDPCQRCAVLGRLGDKPLIR
jgi:hypothetical protein